MSWLALRAQGAGSGREGQGPGESLQEGGPFKSQHACMEIEGGRRTAHEQRLPVSVQQAPCVRWSRGPGRALPALVVAGAAEAALLTHPGGGDHLFGIDGRRPLEADLKSRRGHPLEAPGVHRS